MLLVVLIVLGLFFVVETILMEVEHWGWATTCLLGTFVLSLVAHHFWQTPSLVDWVVANGVFTLAYVGAYLAVGVGWSFIKWFSYLMGFRDAFREQKEAFCLRNGLDPKAAITDEKVLSEFDSHLSHNVGWSEKHRGQLLSRERPRAAKSKARITAWMAFWPFSVVGTVLNDPVRRLFNFLYSQFKALYQKMSDFVFRKDVELK
jgi:hypothetical protein